MTRFAPTKLIQPLGDGSYVLVDESSGSEIVLAKEELERMWQAYRNIENATLRGT